MDILLNDNGDGAAVGLTGGDLTGCGTLYNAVYLSLFGGDNFSNAFEDYEQNNEFQEALNLPINLNNFKTVQNKGNAALKWMLDEGVADSIDCYAYGGDKDKIHVDITITEPSGENQSFGIVWENQKAILKVK